MTVHAIAPGAARADATELPVIHRAWLGILILAITIASGSTLRTLFSPLQEAAKADLHLTDVQISLAQGLAAAIPIALLSLPVGWWTDHGRRVRILTGLVALWTAGTLMTAFVDGFWPLIVGRMLTGFGSTCAVTVAISLAADLCLPKNRGRSLLFLTVGNIGGVAIAFALGGQLLDAFANSGHVSLLGLTPWRELHLIFGLFSAALILPLLTMAEPARREVGEASAALKVALRELWDRRAFLGPLFIGQISVTMADAAAGVWVAPVLMRNYDLTPSEFGGWVGAILLGCGLLGAIIGGLSADWGQRQKMRGGVLLSAVIAAGIGVPTALFPIMPTVPGFAVMFAVLILAGTVTGLVTATTIAVLVPNEIRGVCLGAFIVISSLVGLGAAPVVVAWFSQLLGGEHQIGLSLAIVGVVTGAASLIAFWLAMRNAPQSATEA